MKIINHVAFGIIMAFGLAGCAGMNDALTPSAHEMVDPFDGSTIIRQEPVSSASSISEDWHTLGFEWTSKDFNKIFVTAGIAGTQNITGLAFNADGKIIDNIQEASVLTEYGQWSTRRFVMSLQDFMVVANATEVKMKVVNINKYTVSSFGKSHPMVQVQTKLEQFVAKLKARGIGV